MNGARYQHDGPPEDYCGMLGRMDDSPTGGAMIEELSVEIRKKIADVPYMRTILGFTRWYDSSQWSKLPTRALRRIADIIRENAEVTHAV
jgi:hypothetical protein